MTRHNNPVFKKIADENTILLGQVGSGLHGVTTGDDDRDEMGVLIEPPEYVIGNSAFQQYEFRTQPDGVRSGAGDLDKVVYSLRKWARLAANGNPTVLMLLYIPRQELVHMNDLGADLRARPQLFLSREVAKRFGGYLVSQRDQMLGVKGQKHTNRPELVQQYGFDSKFAYHMVRLGLQGVELLTTGRITLPMPEPHRTWLTELRHGLHTKEEALEWAEDLREELNRLADTADLPEQPDRDGINSWLTRTYTSWWEERGLL